VKQVAASADSNFQSPTPCNFGLFAGKGAATCDGKHFQDSRNFKCLNFKTHGPEVDGETFRLLPPVVFSRRSYSVAERRQTSLPTTVKCELWINTHRVASKQYAAQTASKSQCRFLSLDRFDPNHVLRSDAPSFHSFSDICSISRAYE